jgi:hypothetical protein
MKVRDDMVRHRIYLKQQQQQTTPA